MNNINEYINSSILEMYVLGLTTPEENIEINLMASLHIKIKNEIDAITIALQKQVERNNVIKTSDTLKSFLFAIIDYTERIKAGEPILVPPILNINSKITDFAPWLNRKDIFLPEDYGEFHAKAIGYNDEAFTLITWIKTGAPEEVHENEFERFLIIEGTCDITIGETTHHLKAGDYMEIPLHINHNLIVTSSIPCKVILQRVAA